MWNVKNTNGGDGRKLPRIAEVTDHVNTTRYPIGQFEIRENSAEGNIHTILRTPILPSCTRHNGQDIFSLTGSKKTETHDINEYQSP